LTWVRGADGRGVLTCLLEIRFAQAPQPRDEGLGLGVRELSRDLP
jgi:hypothetical protein